MRGLQNNKIPRIHGKAEISKPISTSIALSPSMMNLNVPTTVQNISDTPHQRRGRPISLAVICNHVNKQFVNMLTI